MFINIEVIKLGLVNINRLSSNLQYSPTSNLIRLYRDLEMILTSCMTRLVSEIYICIYHLNIAKLAVSVLNSSSQVTFLGLRKKIKS